MKIHLTEQEQAQLRDVAQRTGRNTEDVVRQAINSFLQHEREFVDAVEKGLATNPRYGASFKTIPPMPNV